MRADRTQQLRPVLAPGGSDHPGAEIGCDVDSRLAQRRCGATDQQGVVGLELEIPVQSQPRRGIALGNGGQVRPVQRRLDWGHVGGRRDRVLGVAAVAHAAQAAHDRHHLGPLGQRAGGIRGHRAHRLDPADRGRLRPLSFAHVSLGVVDPERLDPDQYLPVARDRLGHLLDPQDVGSAGLGDHHRAHHRPSFPSAPPGRI